MVFVASQRTAELFEHILITVMIEVGERGEDSIVLAKIIPSNYAIEASLPIPNIKRLR